MILFSKPAGDAPPSGVDRRIPSRQVGHNRAGKAGLGSSTFPADLSPLRPGAPTGPSPVCVAATNPSPGAAGGVGATAGAGSPNSSGGSGLSLDRVVRSSGPGSPLPRVPRGTTFAWCAPCGRRDAAHRWGRCLNEERHP